MLPASSQLQQLHQLNLQPSLLGGLKPHAVAFTTAHVVLAVAGRLLLVPLGAPTTPLWLLQQARADTSSVDDDEASNCLSLRIAAVAAYHNHIEIVDADLLALRHIYFCGATMEYLQMLRGLLAAGGLLSKAHVTPSEALVPVTAANAVVVKMEELQKQKRGCRCR